MRGCPNGNLCLYPARACTLLCALGEFVNPRMPSLRRSDARVRVRARRSYSSSCIPVRPEYFRPKARYLPPSYEVLNNLRANLHVTPRIGPPYHPVHTVISVDASRNATTTRTDGRVSEACALFFALFFSCFALFFSCKTLGRLAK